MLHTRTREEVITLIADAATSKSEYWLAVNKALKGTTLSEAGSKTLLDCLEGVIPFTGLTPMIGQPDLPNTFHFSQTVSPTGQVGLE